MEREIKMAARLYECRDVAKRFFKEEYSSRLQPYIHIIKEVMVKHNINELEALLIISKTHAYQDSGMAQMLFMAGVVELIEPTGKLKV